MEETVYKHNTQRRMRITDILYFNHKQQMYASAPLDLPFLYTLMHNLNSLNNSLAPAIGQWC